MTTPLQKAAQAMIDRWESTDWKDTPHTAHYVAELRKALDAELAQAVKPYAVFHGLVDSGEHGAFNLDLLKMIPRGAYLYLHPPQPQATTPVVPENYVLVPIEPTPEMLQAISSGIKRSLHGAYKAMLAAAQGEKP